MDHVAILRKAVVSKGDNLLGDIISGKKTIESRWYVNKVSPWNKISKGDRVYFKESGRPVTAVADVDKALQYSGLTEGLVKEIINKYGSRIAPGSDTVRLYSWAKKLGTKSYCILIFLKNVKKLRPFDIDKTGYGISSAWLCVGDIDRVRYRG